MKEHKNLLPCPFCGGEPEEDANMCIEYSGHEHQDYSITCKQCGAEVRCDVGDFKGADAPCSCHHDTRKICADKWNRRAATMHPGNLTNEDTKRADNSPVIPDGWKLVPETATKEMIISAMSDNLTGEVSELYDLMISAAPQPPVSAHGWIKCSDRMPEDDSYVVAAELGSGDIYAAVAAWFLHGRFNLIEDGISASNYDGGACIEMNLSVTHWMPLPTAPHPEASHD